MLAKVFRFVVVAIGLIIVCDLFFDRVWLILFVWPIAIFIEKKWNIARIAKHQRIIRDQFKMFLYGLSTALCAGKSLENSLHDVQLELTRYYPMEKDLFLHQLAQLNVKLKNGLSVEHSIVEFGEQLNNEEILKFCHLIRSVKRQSGDLLSVIRKASQVIAEKIEVQQEIQVITAQKKFESRVMMVTPLLFLAMLKWTSSEYMHDLYHTTSGLMVMVVSFVVLLIAAYLLNQNMSIQL